MKLFFLAIVIVQMLGSCTSISNSTDRTPSSSTGSECEKLDDVEGGINSDQSLCLFAENYFKRFTNGRSHIEVESNTSEVLSLKIVFPESDYQEVKGRGGMRIRYARFILNEMSIARVTTINEGGKRNEELDKFKLVQLQLVSKTM